ncbi:unnamed protein product [Nippostrongylus brasiliensis]|uniref:NYN domain-containing protein n=1 Tax=Nippostrongylus brasiliensis TaxID=27835 RepID=A0A0N4XU49_NIPBR|nr:unnamed protein product [Nippostrongylus brasiliensis]
MGLEAIKTLYVIGDNPMSDVLGAKLFDRYLRHGGRGRFDHLDLDLLEESDPPEPVSMLLEELSPGEQTALKQPDFVENDLYSAVQLIVSREKFRF